MNLTNLLRRSTTKTRIVLAGAALALAALAVAGASYARGQYWIWDNNFNNSNIGFTADSTTNPTWTATFNFSSNNLYGYPASILGSHYGWNLTGDPTFPRKVSTANSIPSYFSYGAYGSNMAGDFAYDIFLRKDASSGNPQLEVMIWGNNNSYPIGSRIVTGVYTANGVTYDLWYGNNSAAGYYVYTFIPQRGSVPSSLPNGNGTMSVDIRQFLNKLNGRANYSDSMYVDVVEAGFEIVRGNGHVSCYWFDCSVS